MGPHRLARLLAATVAVVSVALVWAPSAVAATRGGGVSVPLAFLGLPSLHDIIEGIAKGFFSALAGALVPGFLKHGTVATIQRLVALPDLASWGHVGELQGDMTYLGMSLMPVTLAVCTLRYWMMGLTGAAHPVSALARCGWATGMLVIYRWVVEQAVAATNTLTHAILGFPVVANGLASIITVLFGGALLVGAGGVFGAFLVIVGLVFAAALFASAEALTVLLALVFCAGPPFIALAPIPELSHLARVWGHALLAIVLVPIGWTILFATAGALTLDATSVTHGAGGLPAHIAAAFAGLITFILAVKLPMMLFGELRHILGGALRGGGGGQAGSQSATPIPGRDRMRAAHASLRSFAGHGMPALGRSVGQAAGELGAPKGGPLGAARRGLTGAARRAGILPGARAALAGAGGGAAAGVAAAKGGVRERLSRARTVIGNAPEQARAAMASGTRAPGPRGGGPTARRRAAADATKVTPARVTRGTGGGRTASNTPGSPAGPTTRTPRVATRTQPVRAAVGAQAPHVKDAAASTHPGRKVTNEARRDANSPPGEANASREAVRPPAPKPAKAPPPVKRRKTSGRRSRKGPR